MPRVAVLLGVTSLGAAQLHAGVLFAEGGGEPWSVLHLGWHVDLRLEQPPPADMESFVAVPLSIDSDREEAMGGFLREVHRQNPQLGYSAHYSGGSFDFLTGTFSHGAPQAEHGLTCATFVLAVLRGAGVDLLDITSWPHRQADEVWLQRIIRALSRSPGVSAAHVAKEVRIVATFKRYAPEEVAGAALVLGPQPASFDDVQPSARYLRSGVFLTQLLDCVCSHFVDEPRP